MVSPSCGAEHKKGRESVLSKNAFQVKGTTSSSKRVVTECLVEKNSLRKTLKKKKGRNQKPAETVRGGEKV